MLLELGDDRLESQAAASRAVVPQVPLPRLKFSGPRHGEAGVSRGYSFPTSRERSVRGARGGSGGGDSNTGHGHSTQASQHLRRYHQVRIETNLCRGRQSRADRDRRHKRNSKLPHDCLLCWSHS